MMKYECLLFQTDTGAAMAETEKSVTLVIVTLMLTIAVIGWGFLAGSYSGATASSLSELSEEEIAEFNHSRSNVRRTANRGEIEFVFVAIEQLPNIPAVIGWHFSNRIWVPILILVLEAGALFGGLKMKSLEKQLSTPHRRR